MLGHSGDNVQKGDIFANITLFRGNFALVNNAPVVRKGDTGVAYRGSGNVGTHKTNAPVVQW
jgi:hypothetical protein